MTYDRQTMDAQATANVVALEPMLNGRNFNREAIDIARGKGGAGYKLYRLHRLTDDLTRVATPHSACRNGCSHCCNMAVSVTQTEAREISKFIGVKYQNVGTPMPIPEAQELYMGKPCTFLKEGKCSIYQMRPLACRVYFNMSDTPEICDVVTNPRHDIPCLNAQGVQIAQALALGTDFADIREYFPPENLDKPDSMSYNQDSQPKTAQSIS